MLACRTGTLNNLLFKAKHTHTQQERTRKNEKKLHKNGVRSEKIYKCQINSIKANLTLNKRMKQQQTHTSVRARVLMDGKQCETVTLHEKKGKRVKHRHVHEKLN